MVDGASDALADADGRVFTTGDGGICQILIDDSFTNNPLGSWTTLGVASFGTSVGSAVLVPKGGNTDSAGAIWWKTPLTFTGRLRAIVDFAIDADGVTSGDGIAVAWVSTAKPPQLGDPRLNFGICSSTLDGAAVAAESKESNQKLLVMSSVSGICGTNNGVFGGTVTNATSLEVIVQTGSLSGALSNGLKGSRSDVTLPKTGYFGISASTGNGFASHVVQSVKVMSCN